MLLELCPRLLGQLNALGEQTSGICRHLGGCTDTKARPFRRSTTHTPKNDVLLLINGETLKSWQRQQNPRSVLPNYP